MMKWWISTTSWLPAEAKQTHCCPLAMRSTLFSTRFKFCIKVNKNSKSYFCQKLQQQGHSGVKRWTRKIDIFDVDRIVIPIHLGVHWTCAALLMEQKKVIYLDSMGGTNEDCRRTLLDYLRKEHKLRWVFYSKIVQIIANFYFQKRSRTARRVDWRITVGCDSSTGQRVRLWRVQLYFCQLHCTWAWSARAV